VNPTGPPTLELRTWRAVNEALRRKELRQALYDEGSVVMADCLLTLHGDSHRDRRRLENRLFRREVFDVWENDLLARTLSTTLAPFVGAGRGDLIVIGYRLAMNLTAHVAGIDHDATDTAATEALYAVVKKFSEGATLVHSTRDKDVVRAEVQATLDEFTEQFLEPATARRRELLAAEAAGGTPAPADVLTTLLRNQDRLDLPPEVVRREIAFYLQAGAHSTANAFTHTLDHLFTWGTDHPADLTRARTDRGFVQRAVHESLRLDPASPVAWRETLGQVELAEHTVPAGTRVVLLLQDANRDPDVWGTEAERFDPHRVPPEGVAPWGLSFGGGAHACIGQELDGGVLEDGAGPRLFGTVAVMAHAVLHAGGSPDPAHPPVLDTTSTRRHFSSYPVVFASSGDPT
jgi:cytochrome P450